MHKINNIHLVISGLPNISKYLPLVISLDSSKPNLYAISCNSFTFIISPGVESEANAEKVKKK